MKRSYYIFSNGKIIRKDNTISYINEKGERKDLPIENVGEIYFMSEITLNSSFLNLMSRNGIILHFYNYYSQYMVSYYPRESLLSGKLLVNQVEHYSNSEKRLCIAKAIIIAASANIYRNLRYYNGKGKNVENQMEHIAELRKEIVNCMKVSEVMGIEGNIRKVYYSAWNTIIDQNIDFQKRVKFPPDNMINTLISYVNSIIYSKTLTEIYQTQLNPTVSYLHEPGERRFSLCLDLSEIFKPLIGDRIIFSLLNRKQITEKSFERELNYLHLKKNEAQIIMQEIDRCMSRTIMHKDLGRKVSYQYLIRLEAYKLIKHLIGEKEYEGFEMWW